ncbi:myb-like protein O [Phymastichus coffea]|uniref:myb-like protein O n=1 Tax=Phymastichus coffea TaxID=108790 RepID=UPI00273AB782|nr:myb-like protein O [Phymastichus coffea]
MRLSIILELLLIFLLIAFAAYARVIDSSSQVALRKLSTSHVSTPISLKQAAENVNKYCVCNENICNCCRDFHIPLVQLSGPGCASLQYLQDNKLAMQLSIGDNILSSNVINGNNPKPVCVNLPGGFSKFCGKIYSIKKEADKHFKACLGLELRSASELEASLRVSCFRFGPDGLKLRPAEPLPPTFSIPSSNTDDDYDDIFSLDDDDEDDDDDDEEAENNDPEKVSQTSSSSSTAEQQNQDQGVDEEDDDDDLLGLSALLDIFAGDDDATTNKKPKPTSSTSLPASFTIPILAFTTTSSAPLVTTTPSILNKGTPADVLASRPHSTTSSILEYNSQKISTEKTVEMTTDATVLNDESINADAMKISQEDESQSTGMGTTEKNDVSLDRKKVINGPHDKKSKLNSTEIKQTDKKNVGTKLHSITKVNKLGTTQQVIAADSTEIDNSSESIYDDENDDDDNHDQASDENNSDIKQTEATNENDKTVNTENTGASDIDYDQSYEESDEDEDADVEVMSTLLEDEISTEKNDYHKDKVKTNKIKLKKEQAAPTRNS